MQSFPVYLLPALRRAREKIKKERLTFLFIYNPYLWWQLKFSPILVAQQNAVTVWLRSSIIVSWTKKLLPTFLSCSRTSRLLGLFIIVHCLVFAHPPVLGCAQDIDQFHIFPRGSKTHQAGGVCAGSLERRLLRQQLFCFFGTALV